MAIHVDVRNGQTWLQLVKPPVNAVDLSTIQSIEDAVRTADPDGPLIVIGDGKAFCAGVDTKAFAAYSAQERGDMVRGITRMVAALVEHPAPVIAAVNGHALGGGLVLALTADYRIAGVDETARFGLTEAQAGVPFPQGPVEIIHDTLSPDLLRRLTLTSETVDAATLHKEGVFDLVCDPETLRPTTEQRAASMAAQPAFRAVKAQIRGELSARLRSLVDRQEEPMLAAFHAV